VASAFSWFWDGFLFADQPLTRRDQRSLLTTWLKSEFFPSLRRTRIIPTFLGPQGSGKTSAERRIGQLLLGPTFEVTGLQREDAFVAAVTNRTICAFDNADSRIPWLEDSLATYATGHRYRLRRLYTTNLEATFEPRAIVMLSSRDPHFHRPDVAERLLPIYFERPERYEPEERLARELEGRRGAIMGSLLNWLAIHQDFMLECEPPPLPFRMADFAAFGHRVFAPLGKADEWLDRLRRLERAQAAFASETNGVVEVLRRVLECQGRTDSMPVGELYKTCRAIADAEGVLFPDTVTAFGKQLTILKRVVEVELGVRLQEQRRHKGTRWVSLVPAS
jgi:hypothetical protein